MLQDSSKDSIDKPPVNEIARIVYSVLLGDTGLNRMGVAKELIPALQDYCNKAVLRARVKEFEHLRGNSTPLGMVIQADGQSHSVEGIHIELIENRLEALKSELGETF